MKPSAVSCAVLIWAASACTRAPQPSPRVVVAESVRGKPDDAAVAVLAVVPPAPNPELGARSDQFLVLADSGEITLRSRATSAVRLLVPHADAALYQAALELLWFRDGPDLSVLDLRDLSLRAARIASGLPDINRLAITHPVAPAETDDGCDLDIVTPPLERDAND